MLATLAASGGAALAQWAPSQPISFIVMAGEGGGADKAVRFMAKVMQERQLVSVPINPINIPGGSGADAMMELMNRTGDNHAIMFTLNSFYTTPLRRPELGIDVSRFTPIGRMAEDTFVLWVHTDRTDINSMDDFIRVARAQGSNWVMAGTGTGAEDNLLTDFLNATYGLNITYKPLKGGGAVAKDLVNKVVNSTVNNPSEQNKYYAQGITKPIATFTPRRLSAYIQSPTLRETGVDFHYFMQRSVVGAPGMSASAGAYYQNLFRAFFDSPEWQEYRQKNSLQGEFLTGRELQSYWIQEREKHARWQMAIDILAPR
ncbi:MAG: tripartite tricarboxylate transporter substrate binding protein [Rhodobacteraceae bacterium]|nr:tripartite tricarboxylate transporter substrate binding protein [Paracoccaceae bacterium]